MFNLNLLKTLIDNNTNYVSEFLIEDTILIGSNIATPKVAIGYQRILPQTGISETLTNNDFNDTLGSDLVQIFEIQIACTATLLPTIWKDLYTNLIGKILDPLNPSTSTMQYLSGAPTVRNQNGILWVDHWSIHFPSL